MEPDKAQHLLAGAAIAVSVKSLGGDASAALAAGAAAGALKELVDMAGFGHPDGYDFAYTVLGALVVIGAMKLMGW